jgi:hypothetical protein
VWIEAGCVRGKALLWIIEIIVEIIIEIDAIFFLATA